MTDNPIAPDNPLDPFDAPDVINQKAITLALRGVLLQGILLQNPQHWYGLCARVKLGHARTRVEVTECADGPDLAFVLEVCDPHDEWHGLIRCHREQLGLPRLADKAHMLALLTADVPDDLSGLGE